MFLSRGFRNPAWEISLFLSVPLIAWLWQLEATVHRAAICCHNYGLWCLVKNTGQLVPSRENPPLAAEHKRTFIKHGVHETTFLEMFFAGTNISFPLP
jgi:hypothetical protein